MEIIAISAVVGAVAFGLGIACGKSSPCVHDCQVPVYRSYVSEVELVLERLYRQRAEQELEYVKRNHRYETRYFAQTVEQQKMADMLAKAKDTASQLVKDLSA